MFHTFWYQPFPGGSRATPPRLSFDNLISTTETFRTSVTFSKSLGIAMDGVDLSHQLDDLGIFHLIASGSLTVCAIENGQPKSLIDPLKIRWFTIGMYINFYQGVALMAQWLGLWISYLRKKTEKTKLSLDRNPLHSEDSQTIYEVSHSNINYSSFMGMDGWWSANWRLPIVRR